MYAHRMETTVDETGAITLNALPFTPGDEVEIIILKRETSGVSEQPSLSFARITEAFCGKIKHAPADLSTNPVYFEGFGE
uniref:Uncharacterized protein n=1 Tax=Candidatus Kentrum sp. FM TaxID=2126340 RepID=A0A450TZT9_9GAMM|nr:MAG: hypothetical protein BECKFM1743C_GA0114222_108163 [Candidatus Kentron sp. FM]VFJ75593.1 MAG: hypothetical protein BECKFM1743A_GA0114220_108493 [Candidatus Kentron sp. FM]VFK23371.1 MAG: hypothetical protein BECKFM1743B_GA0114221_109213 [Candidatus Kentron sp. FM]